MQENDFLEKVATRTSAVNARLITDALKNAGLLDQLEFMKDGQSASVFNIKDSGLVLKIFDRRIRKNPRIFTSKYHLHDYYRSILKDESTKDEKGNPTEVVVEIEPKLTDVGVTKLHQEMLRYKLWTDEGIEFWDTLPPPSNLKEIKNVLIDHRGVPYQIDEDAAKFIDDKYNEYPADGNGRRTDEQYRAWRANQLDENGRLDSISSDKFMEIKESCSKADWPVDQHPIFDPQINFETLKKFSDAITAIDSARLRRRWSETTKRATGDDVTPPL
ncbi:MAG: hypothetical protein ACK502_10125 [Alphaproteobacteria bacterium]